MTVIVDHGRDTHIPMLQTATLQLQLWIRWSIFFLHVPFLLSVVTQKFEYGICVTNILYICLYLYNVLVADFSINISLA